MDDDWPEDSIPASEVPACKACNSLLAWQTMEATWCCMICSPPIDAQKFWAFQKRKALAPVVKLVRRDAWFAAEHERMLLFPEEAM